MKCRIDLSIMVIREQLLNLRPTGPTQSLINFANAFFKNHLNLFRSSDSHP